MVINIFHCTTISTVIDNDAMTYLVPREPHQVRVEPAKSYNDVRQTSGAFSCVPCKLTLFSQSSPKPQYTALSSVLSTLNIQNREAVKKAPLSQFIFINNK